MEKTKNYEIFRKHVSNRELVEENIIRVMKSIQQKNLLEYKPVIVNSDMEIIDGQHRIEACKRLGLEVPYIIQKDASAHDMYLLNQQRVWGKKDNLNYYITQGVPAYVKLSQFMKENDLSLSNALVILNGRNIVKSSREFNSGNYRFPNNEKMAEIKLKMKWMAEVGEFIQTKYLGDKIFMKSTGYHHALSCFLNIKGVEIDRFLEKLGMRLDLIRPCTREKDYLDIFKAIYNFRSRKPLDFDKKDGDPEKEGVILHI